MADITITVPDDKVQRVRDAFAFIRGVDASEITLDTVKGYILDDLKQVVTSAEEQKFKQTFVKEDLGVS